MAVYNKYVDKVSGSDSNDGDAWGVGNAYATIQKAIDELSATGTDEGAVYIKAGTYDGDTASVDALYFGSATNGDTYNFEGVEAGVIVEGKSASYSVLINTTVKSTLSFTNMTFQGSKTTAIIAFGTDKLVDLTLTDCKVTNTHGTAIGIEASLASTATDRKLTLIDTDVSANGSALNLKLFEELNIDGGEFTTTVDANHNHAMFLRQIELVEIQNCTDISSVGDASILLQATSGGTFGTAHIHDCHFDNTDLNSNENCIETLLDAATLKVYITDCTAGSGSSGIGGNFFRCSSWAQVVHVRNNTIVATTTGSSSGIIQIGGDGWDYTQPLGDSILVEGNHISFTDDKASHIVLVGGGTDGVIFRKNKIIAGNEDSGEALDSNIGLVLKNCNRAQVYDNLFVAYLPYLITGSMGVGFFNNTGYSTGGTSCLTIQTETPPEDDSDFAEEDDRTSYGCTIYDNIFHAGDAPNEADYSVYLAASADSKENTFQNNCYYNGDTAIWGDSSANTADNMTELRTEFAVDGAWYTNSYHAAIESDLPGGLMADPQLDVNYVPQNNDVLVGGTPDVNGNDASMGAIPSVSISAVYPLNIERHGD